MARGPLTHCPSILAMQIIYNGYTCAPTLGRMKRELQRTGLMGLMRLMMHSPGSSHGHHWRVDYGPLDSETLADWEARLLQVIHFE
jgi:hypothetical protein